MDYDTIEALVDAPFQKEHKPSLSTEMNTARRDSRSSERVPSVDGYRESRQSGSPRDTEGRYSRSKDRDDDRSGSRRHRRSRSRSPRHSRDHRDHRDYGDYYKDHRDYRDYRDRDYRDYRESRSHQTDRYDRDRRRSYSRERSIRRSKSPRGYGGSHHHRRRRSPSPPADEATCDRRTVFVMQLSARLRSSELEEFFSRAGKVRAARIIEDRNTGRSKGVGYVEFYEEESVAKAIELTGQKLLGIPVIAKHTESEKNRLALQASNQAQAAMETPAPSTPVDLSQHRLYVGSVNFDLTEEDLKQVLEPFGPIEFIKLHRDAETGKSKGFAFVQYKNAIDAKQAMERMNGYVLAGRAIKVGLVTEKGTTQNNGYQYNSSNGQINNSISIDDSDTAGYAMTSQSRADLMQKLARGDASLGATANPPAAPSPTTTSFVPPRQLPVVMPSRAVLLKNMFTDEDKLEPDWAQGLEEDVKEEAEKSGPVVHIHVEQESQGEIYLKFDTIQSATNAVHTLGGRFFAGRQIVAAFLPEMLYNVRFPRAANL
ncbi:hypothetical protein BX616_001360 [Lobosporangium transversale]|uniref:RRM domain-containing protein n=1 Tax=Lobosporangium transversale TaxID=64571 RepID=A0A1Y2GMW7_9FUNG|nr:hypothetical protein BCR41DRAFT_354729 [Lobosporangium transversale]KAF9917329.1 hypothetical protein BX616_001360 [Lobosporangium transversale]ORZ14354.1 hypothetical protein BCR41DRAFT_354729 [Lobosporangium transversale]|eukprot:XP_021880832.1 hypothetical protein BCR41DRAFT_354729 [Lobosporangium transversale]